MVKIQTAEGGVYVSGAPPLPDGTFIPYNYDPSQDNTTPPEVKELVVRILEQVALQQGNVSAEPASVARAPPGSQYNTRAPTGTYNCSPQDALCVINSKWNAFSSRLGGSRTSSLPQALRSRKQSYAHPVSTPVAVTKPVKVSKTKRTSVKKTAKTPVRAPKTSSKKRTSVKARKK
jgi:hypothetical protein